jgi:nucleotide-binding universal stress UspA family protein
MTPPAAIGRILVPVDFAECSAAALRYALDLCDLLDARAEALHVVELARHLFVDAVLPASDGGPQTFSELAWRSAQREMVSLIARVGGRSWVDARLEIGHPRAAIVAAARRAEMVVIGTRGRRGLAHLLRGRIVERVIREAPCPVITVRPDCAVLAPQPVAPSEGRPLNQLSLRPQV